MAKCHRILELTKKHPNWSSSDIAEIVNCHSAYVRTVWHRNGIFKSKHDPNVSYKEELSYVRVPIDEYNRLIRCRNEN